MSIEKMFMLKMVGHIDDLDTVSKLVVLSSSIQLVNTMQEFNTMDFNKIINENNRDKIVDASHLRPYKLETDDTNILKNIKTLKDMCTIGECSIFSKDQIIFDRSVIENNILKLNEEFETVYNPLCRLKLEKEDIIQAKERLTFLKELDIPLHVVEKLNYFDFKIYKLSKENCKKFMHNYENMHLIIFKVYENVDYEIAAMFIPKLLKNEGENIFKSLNAEVINLLHPYDGTPKEIIRNIDERVAELDKEINILNRQLLTLSHERQNLVDLLDKSVELEIKASEVKRMVAHTNEFFYLCGWIPESNLKKFKKEIEAYEKDLIILQVDSKDVDESFVPPTKLKNNKILRPFEALVEMYGTPSYNELDPTTFLGITYMILFGAMFGDLGQGLIFVIAGLLLKYCKKRTVFGPVLVRLGISSSIFGVVYGSFFGFENVIPSLIGRPMENINDTLIYAVAFGCLLLIIAFIFSLINNFKKKNLEEGLFGHNGLVGMIFFLLALTFVILKVKQISIGISSNVWIIMFIILLISIVLKQPIANLIKNKRPLYDEKVSDYFIEGIFGIFEFLLGIFSNTLSFIRVGAFAINHAGLFLAFTAMAKMINSGALSVFMYIIGNIVIIGLEGLIVFIQGLRLQYYELFGKYYEGAGTSFQPISISMKNKI